MLPADRTIPLEAPAVVTLHDLAHELTEVHGPLTPWIRGEVWQWTRLAHAIIFSSEFIRDEAIRLYQIPREKTFRVYLAPLLVEPEASGERLADLRARYSLPKRFALAPLHAAPHKNPHILLEAFGRLKREGMQLPLVLVGPLTENLLPGVRTPSLSRYHLELQRRILLLDLEIGRDLFLLGYVPDEEIPLLYQASSVVITATRSEAGLSGPILEGMWYRRPILCSAIPPFLERLGSDDRLALLFDPEDPEDLIRAIRRWADDPEGTSQRVREAYTWVNQRNWDDAAREYLDIFHSVAALKKAPVERVVGRNRPVPPAQKASLLLWHAPLFDPSGYADEARQFILGLDSVGVQVRAVPLLWSSTQAGLPKEELARLLRLTTTPLEGSEDPLISVFHTFPPFFRRIPGAAYHIGRTMFETDRIPENWVSACHLMDEIWVPSEFNVESFARSGIPREKLVKIPGGIDVPRYRLDEPPVPIEGRRGFTFLSVFDWHLRKGWDVLLQAFLEEFKPEEDVALILKIWSSVGRTVEQLREEAVAFLRSRGLADRLPPHLIFYQAHLPVERMPGLYRAADAFVLPTRGEGWGRPFMEAMLMGLPVIATRWSGHLEFMKDENTYLLDCRIVEVPEEAWREVPAFRGHRWAEPSVEHLRELLRQVVEDRQGAHRRGLAAREHIAGHFSQERVARWVTDRLAVIAERLERGKPKTKPLIPAHPASHPLAIVWEGSQFVHHSLALVNRELCLQLIEAGHEVSLILYEPDQFGPGVDPRFSKLAARVRAPLSRPADVHICHRWPPTFTPPPEGHWVIIQPWEFGSLPKQWVEVMRTQVDEIWVPSHSVRDGYIKSGVPADRVHVIPNGVDPARFSPGAPPLDLSKFGVPPNRFRFLFVGGTIWRKGIDLLLLAYLKTFTRADPVCLVIKDMGGRSFYRGQTFEQEIRRIQAMPDAPQIFYLNQDLPPDQLPGLYTACDCLVHPYRGEGFGLPIAEAMACGLPVIVTNSGAALDFCHAEVAYLIPARERHLPERRIGDLETVDFPLVAEPDVEALARLMRDVYEHPEEAREKGVLASARIRTAFTWARAAEKAMVRLQILREQPIRRYQRQPTSASKVPQEVERLKAEGDEKLQTGDLEGAIRSYQEALHRHPAYVDAVLALGAALLKQGALPAAAVELHRALRLNPSSPDVLNNVGCLFLITGRVEEAERCFRMALSLDPGHPDARENMMALLQGKG